MLAKQPAANINNVNRSLAVWHMLYLTQGLSHEAHSKSKFGQSIAQYTNLDPDHSTNLQQVLQ